MLPHDWLVGQENFYGTTDLSNKESKISVMVIWTLHITSHVEFSWIFISHGCREYGRKWKTVSQWGWDRAKARDREMGGAKNAWMTMSLFARVWICKGKTQLTHPLDSTPHYSGHDPVSLLLGVLCPEAGMLHNDVRFSPKYWTNPRVSLLNV